MYTLDNQPNWRWTHGRNAYALLEFLQTVNQLLEPIKPAEGCKAFNVYVDTSDENSSLVVSERDMEAGLNIYLRSDDFAVLHGAMSVLGTLVDEFRPIYSVFGAEEN